jgi:DNA repair protein SbcC/Rad50
MKIKNLSCTQFAGVRDRTISFADGINVVYGKNESGKSTMANLIVRTLFQKAKLDRRSNREFCDLYFPSTRKGSNLSGDFADGKIALASKDGDYVLSKEWGVDARCTLSTPEGIVRDQAKIDEILKSVLNYGEGVYSDLLLTSNDYCPNLAAEYFLLSSERVLQALPSFLPDSF